MDEVSTSCTGCIKHENEAEVIEPRGPKQSVRRSKRDRDLAPVAEVTVNQNQVLVENASEDFSDTFHYENVSEPNARDFPVSAAPRMKIQSSHDSGKVPDSHNAVEFPVSEACTMEIQSNRDSKIRDSHNEAVEPPPPGCFISKNTQGGCASSYRGPSRNAKAGLGDDAFFTTVPFGQPAQDFDPWVTPKFQPNDNDDTLLEDVDRFMTALRPIKECQQQVRELRRDPTRSKENLAREAWFWRQHEAKWKTRLPFHTAEVTYNANVHFN